MAVDTRNKRASCVGLGLAALVVLPAPDASVAVADRQQVTYCYAGISTLLIIYQTIEFANETLVSGTFASETLEPT